MPHSSGKNLGGPFAAVASKLSGTQSRLSQSLCTLKEFGAHLFGSHGTAMEPGLGFCQHYLEFPSSLPSKCTPGPILRNSHT